MISLENVAAEVADPFFRKGLMLAVDGSDLQEIRSMLELEIDIEEGTAERWRRRYLKARVATLRRSALLAR